MMVGWDWMDEKGYFGFGMDVERCCYGGADMISVWNVGELHGCWGCDVSDLGLDLVDFPTQSLGDSSNQGCRFWSMDHGSAWVSFQCSWLVLAHPQPLYSLTLGLLMRW